MQSLAEQLHQDNLAGVMFFCSDQYDPAALASEFNSQFACPVFGCTSAGEIGSKYQEGGIVAVSFSTDEFRLHVRSIDSLDKFGADDAKTMAQSIEGDLEFSDSFDPEAMFGMILLDGLSMREEQATALVHGSLQGVSLIGGSAGDSLQFLETRVFANGRFRSGAGVFALIETRLSFRTFKLQHFVPSEEDLVITVADPETRTVYEIDGGPAAEEYASLLGMDVKSLSPQVFSTHPVMLQIGGEWYVRSVQKANPDGSLTFYCAIDEGLPLTLGKGVGLLDTLKAEVERLQSDLTNITCTLGFDCILRRLEIDNQVGSQAVEEALVPLKFAGFSTFGEQFDSVHVNQTLVGVVLGVR